MAADKLKLYYYSGGWDVAAAVSVAISMFLSFVFYV